MLLSSGRCCSSSQVRAHLLEKAKREREGAVKDKPVDEDGMRSDVGEGFVAEDDTATPAGVSEGSIALPERRGIPVVEA